MRKIFAIFIVSAIAGCATTKTWQATGGSRADGVVRLSYEVSLLERAEVDEAQAHELAKSRCSVWGYSDAEAFGGTTRVCNSMGGYGCNQWIVTKEYQCTGADRPR